MCACQQVPALLCILGQDEVQGLNSDCCCSVAGRLTRLVTWAAQQGYVTIPFHFEF